MPVQEKKEKEPKNKNATLQKKLNKDENTVPDDVAEFKKMIDEVMIWLRYTVLPDLEYKELNAEGQQYCNHAKLDLIT